jgi:hypothetical protein
MPNWTRRGVLLALLAIGNLVVWAGVALAVAFVASDRLDLGIESTIREYRATAIASWQSGVDPQLPTDNSTGIAGSQASGPFLSPTTAAPPIEQFARATAVAALASSAGSAEQVPSSEAKDSGGGTGGPSPTAPTQPPIPPDPAAVGAAAKLGPAATTPLVLVDPEFSRLESLDAEMQGSAAGRPVEIRNGESMLNQEITAWLAARPDEPYRSVYVDLREGQVVVTGNVLVLSVPIKVEVAGTMVASDCRPELKISSVKIGGLFTPRFARDEVARTLDEVLDWYPDDYPLCIDQFVVQDNQATVYGHRR